MKAEIIMIGTELLLGQIVDTNASYLARKLAQIGFDLYRKTTIGDNENRIAEAIQNAFTRSDVVITSGGLGPTVDDKTRDAVAAATGRKLALDHDLLKYIEEFFNKRGMALGENNKRQAFIPTNAIPIENPVGTAPGFIVNHQGKFVMSLPGVPHELKHLTENTVLPFLQQQFGINTLIKTRVLKTAGIGESNIDRLISDLEESDNPTVGLAAHLGAVDIRISAKADTPAEVDLLLNGMETKVRDRLGDMIYGMDDETIEAIDVNLLLKHGLKIAILETNTGGELVRRLTSVPGGFSVLSFSLGTATDGILTVLPGDTGQQPLLSREGAQMLAKRICQKAQSDIGVAVIGDEDPDVGPYSKQTGNTYVGLHLPSRAAAEHIRLGGFSKFARIRITSIVLDMLRRQLLKYPG
ncbi:MAG: CinA family nicotinamide mononucleotide deamidase-related protein [Desulfobacterales bacterium]|nr:CinA family nicotinamide mononucleotide deamidase-related protein [Desulfobacterales bacterium]